MSDEPPERDPNPPESKYSDEQWERAKDILVEAKKDELRHDPDKMQELLAGEIVDDSAIIAGLVIQGNYVGLISHHKYLYKKALDDESEPSDEEIIDQINHNPFEEN